MKQELNSKDWKFCAVVDLGIEKLDQENIQFNEHVVRFFKPNDKIVQGFFVAEVYSINAKYVDNETAFFGSLDILTKVLSRLSIAIFRSCKIISSIGITQFKAERNEPFIMLLTSNFSEKLNLKTFRMIEHPELFLNIDEQELNDSISELSLAINTHSIYQKFVHYYNCIERIADFLTEENVKNPCKHCGEINEIPVKATANKMRDLFNDAGYDKKIFNSCRTIRGKLAHGSSERTRKLNLEVLKYISIIEKVALFAIEKNTLIKLGNGEIIPQLNDQFVEIKGKKRWSSNIITNAAYDVISHQIKFNLHMHEVGKNKEGHGFITEHLPLTLNPRQTYIFPYAWPY